MEINTTMKKLYSPLMLNKLEVAFESEILAGSKTETKIATSSSVTVDNWEEQNDEFLNIDFKI